MDFLLKVQADCDQHSQHSPLGLGSRRR